MRTLRLAISLSLLILLAPWAHAADEPDEQMPGTVVVIKPSPLFKFVARPPAGTTFDLPDETNDPTVEGGTLEVTDAGGTMAASWALPSSGWKGLGNPAGSKGYKYKGAGTAADPCKVVVVKGPIVKAVCKGPGVTVTPPFIGEVGIVLTVGTDSKRYCASFGGDEVKNDDTLLKRKGAPAAPCPGSAPTTTSTVSGSTSTTSTTIPTVAFRLTDLDLRDPHLFVSFISCQDVTNTQLVGFSVNNELQTAIQADGDDPPDGLLDLSFLAAFTPLDQTMPSSGSFEFLFGDCTAPAASTSCVPSATGPPPITVGYDNMSTECLAPFAGTTTASYAPSITSTSGPCFVSAPFTLTLDLGGIPLTLDDAQVAATYVGDPASSLANGLVRGFISEADANNTVIPGSFPLIGGQPLSALLPGGTNNCASHSDKDMNGAVFGWWFYFNFPAVAVTYTTP